MIMSDLDEIKHFLANKCFLCNGTFNKVDTATSQECKEERHISNVKMTIA